MKKIPQHIINEIKELLSLSKNIVIITHYDSDGDAIGSALGLYIFLKKKHHKVNIVVPNNYPEFLQWLPENNKILIFSKQKKEVVKLIAQAEIIFNIDYNELSRVKDIEPFIRAANITNILIDHHPDPEPYADYIISDTSVSSTAELVFEFINLSGAQHLLDKSIAECLFTGIMTDTGAFSFNSSLPRTYQIVAELLSLGIDKDKIYSNIYDNFSEHRMKFLGYCLNEKMVIIPEYNTAFISLTKEELKKYKFTPGDSEGFVNYPLSVKGIVFSAIFIEKGALTKISFRSKGNFAVNKFARKYFEGGGHKNAAGGQAELSLDETLKKFVSLLPEYAKELTIDN